MSLDLPDLRTELTRILTAIARESLDGPGYDVAEVVAHAAASAAANVGGPEALLSGRSGSWEAAALRELLAGAMGDDPDHWDTLRTEPVTIHLNVAQLIESGDLHPGLVGLDGALGLLDDTYDDKPDTDEVANRYSDEADALIAQYETGYQVYAERFTAAVAAVATDLHLAMAPTVIVDADPTSWWWRQDSVQNSPAWDDLLVDEIWERAHAVVPLPDVIIATAKAAAT